MSRQSKANLFKQIDARIEKQFGTRCSGIQVSIWDLSKITDAGRKAIATNPNITDDELGQVIYDFVQNIRKN
jgi:hypothetical protein